MHYYDIIKIKFLCPSQGHTEQNDNLCPVQDSGSLAVFKVTARNQGHYKGPSGGHLLHIITFLVTVCYDSQLPVLTLVCCDSNLYIVTPSVVFVMSMLLLLLSVGHLTHSQLAT